MAPQPPSALRKAWPIVLDVALALGALYLFLRSKGAPTWVGTIVAVFLIAGCGVATVNFFRTRLRASEEEAKRNPKPW
jgi:hypothetical protein